MNHMFAGFAATFAQVRPTEVWSAASLTIAVFLLGAIVAGVVAWTVHVMTRR